MACTSSPTPKAYAPPPCAGYFCAARDPIGICSLYWGRGADGSVWFASEMKALQSRCETIDIFPPVGRVPAVEDGDGSAVVAPPRAAVGQ